MNTLNEILSVIPEKHLHKAYTEYDVSQYVENNSFYSIQRKNKNIIFEFIKFVLLYQKTKKTNRRYTLINDRILIFGTNGNSAIRAALYFDEDGNVVGGTATDTKDIPGLSKFNMVGFIEKRIWS